MREEVSLLMPGLSDYDQHYEAANQMRVRPRYEYNETEKRIYITDPIIGQFEIGDRPHDEVFLELYTNPLVQRSSGIEQLTLPKIFSTMPGSTEWPRWEHLFGSVGFVRKLVDKAEAMGWTKFDDRQVAKWQLRTFVSDLAHTAFSHLGDWLSQGFGGSEDQHDTELMEILEQGGVCDILRRHGFDPKEIVFPDIEDWIECPAPDLCIDRVDYGAREISRWVAGYEPSSDWLKRFEFYPEHGLVMNGKEEARDFAIKYALLATEHWSHPVHRLQLELFGELVKSIIVDKTYELSIEKAHPRDALYTVDYDIMAETRTVGTLNHDLFTLMLDIARSQRKIFAHGRKAELDQFLTVVNMKDRRRPDESIQFPHPLEDRSWQSTYTGVKPSQIQLIPADSPDDVKDFGKLPHTLDRFLRSLKPRFVDPKYRVGAKIHRLSETDPLFNRLISQQQAIQNQGYVARIYADPEFIEQLQEKIGAVNESWTEALERPRASAERRQEIFRTAGMLAIGTNPNIHLTW